MRRRRPIRPKWLAAALIALVSTLAVGFGPEPAGATGPAVPTDGPAGYISGLPPASYTSSGSQTISAQLPGNLPGRAIFSTSGLNSRGVQPNTGIGNWWGYEQVAKVLTPPATNLADTPAEFANCLGTHREAGYTAYCATSTMTLTFEQPVVDPVILFSSGWWWPGPDDDGSQGCYAAFSTGGISRINGQAPAAGQVSLVTQVNMAPGDWSYSMVNNDMLVTSGSFPPPTQKCQLRNDPDPQVLGASTTNGFWLKASGLVSSLQLDFPTYRTIYKQLSTNYWTTHTQGTHPENFVGFGVPGSDLSITKTAPASVAAGSDISWKLTISNAASSAASHGFVVKDAVPASVTNPRLVNAPPGCSLSGRDLLCSVPPSGFSVAQHPSVSTLANLTGTNLTSVGTVLNPGASFTVDLAATVPVTANAAITNTATVSGADLDPDTSNNSSTAVTQVTSPWTVQKTATVGGSAPAGGVVKPGDLITYTVTAASQGAAINRVVLTDDLSNVLDDATFLPGSAKLTVGGTVTSVPDPSGNPLKLTTGEFTLPSGGTATLTYQVSVNANAWLATLTNSVTASAVDTAGNSMPPTSCSPCSTTNVTGALVLIQKNGYAGDGTITGIGGSSFQILTDSSGTPGSPVSNVPVQPSGSSGRFQAAGLMPGTYWLKETVAPTGYVLLAQPVAFKIANDGAVTIVNASANPNVTVANGVLTVLDAPSFVLPAAGGAGTSAFALTGLAVLLAAALAWLLLRARRAPQTSAARRFTSLLAPRRAGKQFPQPNEEQL